MDNFWQDALWELKQEIDAKFFDQWFNEGCVLKAERRGSVVYLHCSDEYVKTTLDSFFRSEIEAALFKACGCKIRVFFIDLLHEEAPEEDEHTLQPQPHYGGPMLFNPRYTFDTFVVGSSNRFAHAAAMAVSESPSRTYNPLFIYGGSGLGKTHLMHAIGQAVQSSDQYKKVIYVSSEAFTNEFIRLLRENRLDSFKNRYRATDILLIDDIQFLINKTQIQEEFFHTFNSLHDAGKQIVISSDRAPKELNSLEERLVSRFEWGLITDIQVPDWETRCAILQRKAQSEKIELNDEVVYYIADKIKANIRELEGALNKVFCYSQIMGIEYITMQEAKEALANLLPDQEPPKLTISFIQRVVADYFNITVEDLKGKRKDQEVTLPRQIGMYLCRELMGATQPLIGRDFNRDHTTVIHACEKITRLRMEDKHLDNCLVEISRNLTRS